MVSARDDHVGVGEQKLLFHVGRPLRTSQHAEKKIELTGPQVVQQGIVMAVDDLNARARMGRSSALMAAESIWLCECGMLPMASRDTTVPCAAWSSSRPYSISRNASANRLASSDPCAGVGLTL